MNTRTIGAKYEKLAQNHLTENGCKIITTNYHFHKMGEIDIIYYDTVNEFGKDVRYLCFGEVKYRKSNQSGGAIGAVNYQKQRKISAVAMGFVKQYDINLNHPMRFDVITVDGNDINWLKNAFYYVK